MRALIEDIGVTREARRWCVELLCRSDACDDAPDGCLPMRGRCVDLFSAFLPKILDSAGSIPVSIRSMALSKAIPLSAWLSVGMLFAGCQMFDASTQSTSVRSTSVMSMWELYRHCQTSGDVETVLSAAKQLQQSADTHVVPAPDVRRVWIASSRNSRSARPWIPKPWLRRAPCRRPGPASARDASRKPNSYCMPWC